MENQNVVKFNSNQGEQFVVEFIDGEFPCVSVHLKGENIILGAEDTSEKGTLISVVEVTPEKEARTIIYNLSSAEPKEIISMDGLFDNEYISEELPHTYNSETGVIEVFTPHYFPILTTTIARYMTEEEAWCYVLDTITQEIQENMESLNYKCIADFTCEVEDIKEIKNTPKDTLSDTISKYKLNKQDYSIIMIDNQKFEQIVKEFLFNKFKIELNIQFIDCSEERFVGISFFENEDELTGDTIKNLNEFLGYSVLEDDLIENARIIISKLFAPQIESITYVSGKDSNGEEVEFIEIKLFS